MPSSAFRIVLAMEAVFRGSSPSAVRRPAGTGTIVEMLDAAALRIAKLAEPYPPLPKTAEDPDILNVVRTWRFMPGGTLVDQ